MENHWIKTDADDVLPDGTELAYTTKADPADVAHVLAQPTTGHDGRSDWVWLRLRDGTLALATFPQGDTYMTISDNGKAPFGED